MCCRKTVVCGMVSGGRVPPNSIRNSSADNHPDFPSYTSVTPSGPDTSRPTRSLAELLLDGSAPHRAIWLRHAGPGPLPLDELWRAYLARFDIEHAFKLLRGPLGLTAVKVRDPGQ